MFRQALYFNNLTVLTADGPQGHSLRVANGRVVAIDDPPQQNDRLIDSLGGMLIPGLINAHDHLELNTFKRLKYRRRYTHSLQWIEDIEARFDSEPALAGPRRQPLADRLLVGACKNLLSGVTTVCHHNPLYRPLRRNFPMRVVQRYGFCHSLFRGDDVQASYRSTKPDVPWLIHLAEGIDAAAEAEFAQLERLGVLQKNTVLVHGVALNRRDRALLAERGGGLIWCPGSNNFLFGQTACVRDLAEAGKVALGSDSRLSGEFDLLAELRVAYETGQLAPASLFKLVTVDAARLLRLQSGGRGQIVVGGSADVVLLPSPLPSDPFSRLLDVTRAQVELVLVGGKPLLGSPHMRPVFDATRTGYAPVTVDRAEKLMAQKLVAHLEKSAAREPGLSLER